MFVIFQGYNIIKQKSPIRAYSHAISRLGEQYVHISSSYNRKVCLPSSAISYGIIHRSFVSGYIFEGTPLLISSVSNYGGFCFSNHRLGPCKRSRVSAALDVASAVDVINDLGLDTLTFLGVTVLVVPAFKTIKASPVSVTYAFWSFFFISFSLTHMHTNARLYIL